jgi:hypothetical protein
MEEEEIFQTMDQSYQDSSLAINYYYFQLQNLSSTLNLQDCQLNLIFIPDYDGRKI